MIYGIEYFNIAVDLEFLYPFYIKEGNIIEAIAKALISSASYHEFFHSFQAFILNKLKEDPTVKDRDSLLTILNNRNNREIGASALEVVMYYLVNGFHKDEEVYKIVRGNMLSCKDYIEDVDELKEDKYSNTYIPYNLGYCYGNIIVAKYKSSLKENIYKIIDDIVYLDEKRAIEAIKYYGDNPDELLQDKNS